MLDVAPAAAELAFMRRLVALAQKQREDDRGGGRGSVIKGGV
jgi:hypothetical protein